MNTPKNPAAVALGRLGGSANTPAQNRARARNAKLGGWPKGRPRKAGLASAKARAKKRKEKGQ